MKKPNHAWILFERSGTFKKAFEKFGIPATDFDLEAEHEEVVKVDIFKCIDNAFMDIGGHIFNHFKADDLIIAFFPCTYFSDQSQLISRCDSFSMKDYTLEEKLNLSRVNMRFRADYYDYLCQLVLICKKRNLLKQGLHIVYLGAAFGELNAQAIFWQRRDVLDLMKHRYLLTPREEGA